MTTAPIALLLSQADTQTVRKSFLSLLSNSLSDVTKLNQPEKEWKRLSIVKCVCVCVCVCDCVGAALAVCFILSQLNPTRLKLKPIERRPQTKSHAIQCNATRPSNVHLNLSVALLALLCVQTQHRLGGWLLHSAIVVIVQQRQRYFSLSS